MLKIDPADLPGPTSDALAKLQAQVDAAADYPSRVASAKRLWPRNNRASDPVFAVVRSTLDAMCRGPRRCGYCEDSYADEIDHVWSKDPTAFMSMDLAGTFFFVPTASHRTHDYARADYTIGVLRLNARDALVQARRNAFGTYRARLREYVESKGVGAVPLLQRLVDDLRRTPHATVWAEMKRQAPHFAQLASLFEAAPEALDW